MRAPSVARLELGRFLSTQESQLRNPIASEAAAPVPGADNPDFYPTNAPKFFFWRLWFNPHLPLWLCFPLWVGTEQSSIQSCTSSNFISQSLLQCQPVNGRNKLKMKFWYKQRNFSSTELCVHPSCRQMFITPPKGSQLSLFLIVFKLFRGVLNFTGEESIRSLVLLFPLENE